MSDRCCEVMGVAVRQGSDNEGYSAAVWPPDSEDGDGDWQIGTIPTPIRFCPWCGASLAPEWVEWRNNVRGIKPTPPIKIRDDEGESA